MQQQYICITTVHQLRTSSVPAAYNQCTSSVPAVYQQCTSWERRSSVLRYLEPLTHFTGVLRLPNSVRPPRFLRAFARPPRLFFCLPLKGSLYGRQDSLSILAFAAAPPYKVAHQFGDKSRPEYLSGRCYYCCVCLECALLELWLSVVAWRSVV